MTGVSIHKKQREGRYDGYKELAVDGICCWLICLGVLFALRQLFRFDNPSAAILLRSAIVVAGIVLLTRRWWIPLAAAGALLMLILLSGRLPAVWDFVGGLFRWWINRFPLASLYNTPQNVELVQWLITLGVASLLFLLVRRAPFVWVFLALGAALIAGIYLSGFRENRAALFFFAAGICPLLARGCYSRLQKRSEGVLGSRSGMALAGLAVCCAGTLLVMMLVPPDTSAWKSPALSEELTKIQRMLKGEKLGFEDSLFSLKTSGLQPNHDWLGGDLHLAHTPVMSVETDSPTLLKGMVYSRYTGSGWETDPAEDFVLPSPEEGLETVAEESSAFEETFGQLLPRDVYGVNPLADAMPLSYATVTLLTSGYSVYVPDRLSQLSVVSYSDTPLLYNTRSEVFSRKLLSGNYVYSLRYTPLNRALSGLSDRIAAIEQANFGGGGLYDEGYDRAAAQYLQLPDSLPASVFAKAWEIVGEELSPYKQMVRLESYLKRNYTYTLTPGDVPRGEDFVDYFLQTGQGYCVYFASAMAVMARTLGIPSRFVVGYGLESSGSRWMAYADTAHAWVECYIRGVGWVTFDPTAGSVYRDPRSGGALYPDITDSTTAPAGPTTEPPTTTTTNPGPPPTTAPETVSTGPQGGGGGSGDFAGGRLWWILLASAGLLLLVAVFLLRVFSRRRAFALPMLQARLHSTAACADAYYRDLLRQFHLLGLDPDQGETMLRFGRRAGERLPAAMRKKRGRDSEPLALDDTVQAVQDALAVVMAWRYGQREPSPEELARMATAHEGMERLVRRRLGAFRYFLRRRLFF